MLVLLGNPGAGGINSPTQAWGCCGHVQEVCEDVVGQRAKGKGHPCYSAYPETALRTKWR